MVMVSKQYMYLIYVWYIIFILSILVYPFLKVKGQLIAAKIVKIPINRVEIGRGSNKKQLKLKNTYANISFPIFMKAEVYPNYSELRYDRKQNWKLMFFYFMGPLFYVLVIALIFFSIAGVFWIPMKISGNVEYWENISQPWLDLVLLPMLLGAMVVLWFVLPPLPWRRNSGFKILACLWRGITNKPITSYPFYKKAGEDKIWGSSYTIDVLSKIVEIWWTIMKWTIFILFTLAIISCNNNNNEN